MRVVVIQGVPPMGNFEHLAGLRVKIKNGVVLTNYHGLDRIPPSPSSSSTLTKSVFTVLSRTPTPPLTKLRKLAALQTKAKISRPESEESDRVVIIQPAKDKLPPTKPPAIKKKAEKKTMVMPRDTSVKRPCDATISDSESDMEETVHVFSKAKGKKKARVTPPVPPSTLPPTKFNPCDLPAPEISLHMRPVMSRPPLQMVCPDHPVYNSLRTHNTVPLATSMSLPSVPNQAPISVAVRPKPKMHKIPVGNQPDEYDPSRSSTHARDTLPTQVASGDACAHTIPEVVKQIAHALIPSLKGQPDAFLPPGIVKIAWSTHMEAQNSMYEQAMNSTNSEGQYQKPYLPSKAYPSNSFYQGF
ncbi:hypothetical protein SERLADRAFT_410167 [Serpula lacrymans var. lacrymans S7.9]|nr:uncharacterized protein SERLADRAFT_410167 [Serpula lacrymans var. lacrymans S7.9]EGO21553.1 hypothetical protein SERLADRAFT_410167 [Serpula lacrymans var. lacrymans S7.9]